MTDREAEVAYGPGWRSPTTLPRGQIVEVKSVRGLVAQAWLDDICEPYGEGKDGPLRIKVSTYKYKSVLSAVCWRPIGRSDRT